MLHKIRRKAARRKYKRLVAALAGAAVVSSALLPGLPLSKVHAADTTTVASSPAPTEQTQQQERTGPLTTARNAASAHGFDPAKDQFSLNWRSSDEAVVNVKTAAGKFFKVRLSKENGEWQVVSVKESVSAGDSDGVIRAGDPVDVVRENAGTFGFDPHDKFTLLSIVGSKAIVEVKTSGQKFKVDLERSAGKWVITTIRGIGDSNTPATYRPASLYGYRTLGIATGPVDVIETESRTLYSNDAYSDWTWRAGNYPKDMKVGVLVAKLESTDTTGVPGIIIDKIDTIDFSRQLALYAHIGSVNARGYGIGIERVVQTGNDLTVTVRIKSPLERHRLSPTLTNDVIPIDRLALNFDDPIRITFVDQAGTTLTTYNIVHK